MKINRICALFLLASVLAGCSTRPQAASSTPVVPTPTIAAAPLVPTVGSTPITPVVPPSVSTIPATPTAPPQSNAPTTFTYLWPSYLPDGMAVSPSESRVPRENEVGTTALGFYVVTFNGGDRKLVVGGGATDTLPLQGDIREVSLDDGNGTLTTNGEQRQVVFVRDRAKFFVYGRNISEQELLLVANSLLPTEVTALRDIVGTQ